MRENLDCMITNSPAFESQITLKSCSPAYRQEGKSYLVLPALSFELELFSSRTGSSAVISTHSMHLDCTA